MNLVKGYLIASIIEQAGTQQPIETLYAVSADGTTLRSDAHAADMSFDRPSRRWEPVDALPEHAEFIGNYRLNSPR